MTTLTTGGFHHIVLTVSDLARSFKFYTEVLDFKLNAGSVEAGRLFLINGSMVIGLGLPPDSIQTPVFDQFNENRMGLDHLSIGVESYEILENALEVLDQNEVPHGQIKDLSPAGFPVCVLAFRDPDNIQLELAAPAPA